MNEKKDVAIGEAGRIDELNRLYGEIVESFRTAAQMSLPKAIRMGEVLVEQKALVERGQWQAWVEMNLVFSVRSARVYMELFRNKDQVASGSAAVFSIRDAIKFLGAPEEEPELTPEEIREDIARLRKENAVMREEIEKRRQEEQRPEPKPKPTVLENGRIPCQIGKNRFEISQEEYADLRQALDKATAMCDSEKVGHCLSMICVEFNVLYPEVGHEESEDKIKMRRVNAAVEAVKRVESMYRVKLEEVIDEETGERIRG